MAMPPDDPFEARTTHTHNTIKTEEELRIHGTASSQDLRKYPNVNNHQDLNAFQSNIDPSIIASIEPADVAPYQQPPVPASQQSTAPRSEISTAPNGRRAYKSYQDLNRASKAERDHILNSINALWPGQPFQSLLPFFCFPKMVSQSGEMVRAKGSNVRGQRATVLNDPREWPSNLLNRIRNVAKLTPDNPSEGISYLLIALQDRLIRGVDSAYVAGLTGADCGRAYKMVLAGRGEEVIGDTQSRKQKRKRVQEQVEDGEAELGANADDTGETSFGSDEAAQTKANLADAAVKRDVDIEDDDEDDDESDEELQRLKWEFAMTKMRIKTIREQSRAAKKLRTE